MDATDPPVLMELLRGFGLARMDKADDGTPMIRGRIEGDGYSLFFYDCEDDGTKCRSVGFSTYFDDDDTTLEQVNEWNKVSRFGRALIRDDGKPVLEMDIDLQGGVTAANFESAVAEFRDALKDFADSVVNKNEEPEKPDTVTP